jgi:NAD(P)-dependent dehydrogenase (short-subunit alcohol dehydrogenase family)
MFAAHARGRTADIDLALTSLLLHVTMPCHAARVFRSQLDALMSEYRAASDSGSCGAAGFPPTAYGMSKIGLTTYTRILAQQLRDGVTVNCGCPGWCHTDMTGRPRAHTHERAHQRRRRASGITCTRVHACISTRTCRNELKQ